MNVWKEGTLDGLCKLRRGHDLPSNARRDGVIPIYSSSGISGYHDHAKCSGPGVITGRYGTIGNVFYSDIDYWPLNTTLYVEDFHGNHEKFVYYFLKTLEWEKFNDKSAVPGINRNDVHKEIIKYPEIDEQRAIAAVLSSLDDKIDLLHRQNATLEAMAEALFRQCFVVEAKEEWKHGLLPDEFEFVMGQSPNGYSFNEVGMGIPMFQGNADFGFRFPSARIYTTEPTRFAQKFDTLISVRAPVGAQNMAQERCCIGRGLAAFRYKNNSSFYSYTYFKLRYLLKEILVYNDEGTVFGSISKNDFNNIEIIIPDYNSVLEFENIILSINNKIISNCHQINTLEKLRDTLLPKLMSGEVRVDF